MWVSSFKQTGHDNNGMKGIQDLIIFIAQNINFGEVNRGQWFGTAARQLTGCRIPSRNFDPLAVS